MEILLYCTSRKRWYIAEINLKRFARSVRAKRVKHDGKTTRVLLLRLQLESYIKFAILPCVDSLLDSVCTIIIGLYDFPSHSSKGC